MIKYMISQFERPRGVIGSILAKIMDISNRRMNQAHLKLIPSHTQRILEIGYGSGKTLIKTSQAFRNADIFGIDISEDMYRKVRQLIKNNKKIRISVGNCEELQYQSEYFDCIITTDTCYFWNDPDKAFSEIGRVLKSGGLFSNIYNGLYAKSISAALMDGKLYTDVRIINAAKKHDLRCIKRTRVGLFGHILVFKKY